MHVFAAAALDLLRSTNRGQSSTKSKTVTTDGYYAARPVVAWSMPTFPSVRPSVCLSVLLPEPPILSKQKSSSS